MMPEAVNQNIANNNNDDGGEEIINLSAVPLVSQRKLFLRFTVLTTNKILILKDHVCDLLLCWVF